MGALDRGSPVAHAKFKKWEYPLLLFFFKNIHVNLEIVLCHRLNLKNGPCQVTYMFPMSLSSMSQISDISMLPYRFQGLEFLSQGDCRGFVISASMCMRTTTDFFLRNNIGKPHCFTVQVITCNPLMDTSCCNMFVSSVWW